MSQHDFNIANQTFPSFRADLNDALQAAATISAGATAPTTPYAYQLWFDTSTNTYKARNAANSAWVSLFGNDLTNAGITFGDNDKAIFGTGNDLQIYHNGSNSYVKDSGAGYLILGNSDAGTAIQDADNNNLLLTSADNISLGYNGSFKLATTATGIDVTGTVTADNVGIGTAPDSGTPLHVAESSASLGANPASSALLVERAGNVGMTLGTANTGMASIFMGDTDSLTVGRVQYDNSDDSLQFWANSLERLRVDSGGRVGMGDVRNASLQSGNNTGNKQFYWTGNYGVFASSGDVSLICNRQSTDGAIISFRKNGGGVGSIGTNENTDLYIAGGDTGLLFNDNVDFICPATATGAGRDNAIDLGYSTVRWDDVYATNGTIQTSDANEKQQIAALTDAEMTAAKAISALFKTFKWNDAVAEKGDAARTHAGVIAQDVQAAMTAAGLDAGDYAFFISSTWWETQTEVPAVEAVEAVDAVYEDVVIPAVEEELDEDGNVIVEAQAERTEQRLVSEAVEAVEAVAAYTRTDTYDTAEEAPEGATERTRLGIRYPELLAFVGAATEQRLSNIETRLAALEA